MVLTITEIASSVKFLSILQDQIKPDFSEKQNLT